MSLEDAWKSESTLPFILLLFVFGFIAFAVIASRANRNVYEKHYDAATQKKSAVIVNKYTVPHQMQSLKPVNMVTFEFEDGARCNLPIRDEGTYCAMMVGDKGTLEYAGEMFISFKREQKEAM